MLRIVAFFFCLAIPVAAQAYSQCTTTPVAGPGASIAEEAQNPVMSGKYIYMGYHMRGGIAIAASADSGKTLGKPVQIFSSSDTVGGLRLAAQDNSVYALWGRVVDHTTTELYLDVSNSHGAAGSWLPVVDLGPYQSATLAQFSVDGSNIHAASVTTTGTIQIRNSSDSGKTFSPPVIIGTGAAEVVVASRDRNVFVAWNTGAPRSDTILAVSHDGGATFKVTNLSAQGGTSHEPIFTFSPDGHRLSLIRRDDPAHGVYTQSLDFGDTWSTPISFDSAAVQFMVADDGTYVWVSYLKLLTVNGVKDLEVYLTRSVDGGKTFPPAKNVSGVTGLQTLQNDNERPIPTVNGSLFRLTAVYADGVHVWSGNAGHLLGSAYAGPGVTASAANNSVVFVSPDRVVMYGTCQ